MIIQGLPALANVFVPALIGPVITDVRIVQIGSNAQVQVKVVG